MHSDVIHALCAALESKDPISAKHCKNVAVMTKRFCETQRFSAIQKSILEDAAHIHDVGKIGIPEAVLNFPGRLGESGFALIHAHSEIGAHIASSGGLSEPVINCILHHHEQWDGSGYPLGLKGDAIPYEARVIAVFDSIDAMCGQRYYRKPIFLQKCRDEIGQCARRRYDPEIVQLVLNDWDSIIAGLYE